MTVDNGAKVVVTPGFNFSGALYQAQEKYPDVKFVTIDLNHKKMVVEKQRLEIIQ